MDVTDLVHDDRGASEARPFPCVYEDCGKAFARKSDLVRHERIHTNERPWQCEWPGCERDFIQRSALIVHTRTHTGERPHRCEQPGCTKAFSDSSSLARHRRIHTGKRPYQCTVPTCLKTFCRKTTLTKHIKKNHPQHAHCPERVSLATFESDDEVEQGYDRPLSASSSQAQSPSGESAYAAHYQDDGGRLPTPPPMGYSSYYPPAAPQTPNMRARAQLHPHDQSPGAWSAPGYVEGYHDPRVLATPMSRSVSHETSQNYLTPPPTNYHRVMRPRRGQAVRYTEHDVEDLYEQEELDADEEYVDEEVVRTRSMGRQRRNAYTPADPLPTPSRVSRRLNYATPSPQTQYSSQCSPYPQYEQPRPHSAYSTPQTEYPPTPGPSSYAMTQTYTAPLPQTQQTYTYDSGYYLDSAPRFRRASSVGAVEGLMPPPSAFASPSPQLAHASPVPASLGLGLNLHAAFSAPHERRLSELHRCSPIRPSFALDDLESVPLSSPTSSSFQFPRRGSLLPGFPSLPDALQPNGPGGQRGSFSTLTSSIIDRMETESMRTMRHHEQASGLVGGEAY